MRHGLSMFIGPFKKSTRELIMLLVTVKFLWTKFQKV